MKIAVLDKSESAQTVPVFVATDNCCHFCDSIIDGDFDIVVDGFPDATQ
jgi:hypothetical protein